MYKDALSPLTLTKYMTSLHTYAFYADVFPLPLNKGGKIVKCKYLKSEIEMDYAMAMT